ncbi:MAG: c-type cytochrome biogenesis protein CcmI [Bermanella sp.]
MMSMLWLSVGVLLAVALVFIFIPFIWRLSRGELIREQSNVDIYKSQLAELEIEKNAGRVSAGDYDALLVETKRNLLTDTKRTGENNESETSGRWLAPVLAVALISSSVLLYGHLGYENEVAIGDLLQRSNSAGFSGEDSQELLARLDRKTQKTPLDVESWYLLGRIQFEMGNYKEAVKGFNGVLINLPSDAKDDQAVAMAQLAQAQFFAAGRTLSSATKSLLEATLAINPQETTALGLLGVAAFDKEDFMTAIKYWQQLLALMPAANPNALAIQEGINKAMEQLSPSQQAILQKEEAAKPSASIIVTVDLAPSIRALVPAQADLFILAKAQDGPAMPLAVKRLTNAKWPLTVVLDDSMAMMPALKMSNFEKIIITARISKSGVGNAKPGDIQGDSGVIAVSVKKTQVLIDEVIK